MKFELPIDYCDLPTDERASILKSAEKALLENMHVFFQGKQFTNQDELAFYLNSHCKKVEPETDEANK